MDDALFTYVSKVAVKDLVCACVRVCVYDLSGDDVAMIIGILS